MKLVREHINEKFTEDSDPIKDMDIGIIGLLKKDIEKLKNLSWVDDIYDEYFIKNKEINKLISYNEISKRDFVLTFYQTIKKIVESNMFYQEAFDRACANEVRPSMSYYEIEIKKELAKFLNKRYGFNVK